jgi:DNA-binding FrmR family transcriptional regulator
MIFVNLYQQKYAILYLKYIPLGGIDTRRNMPRKEDVLHQLKIVKGQIDGILAMVEGEDHKCSDVLTQISASEKGLRRAAGLILEGNIMDCVDPSVDQETIAGLVSEFKKFL